MGDRAWQIEVRAVRGAVRMVVSRAVSKGGREAVLVTDVADEVRAVRGAFGIAVS